jgi:hypothetical protein
VADIGRKHGSYRVLVETVGTALPRSALPSRSSPRRLDFGGTARRHEYGAVAVVPAHAEPRRFRRKHFLDDTHAGGLADLLGLDDDAVSDLCLDRVLLQALRGLASIIPPPRTRLTRFSGDGGEVSQNACRTACRTTLTLRPTEHEQQKTPPSGAFLERMMGLEPTTFCMARTERRPTRTDTGRQPALLRQLRRARSDWERHQRT